MYIQWTSKTDSSRKIQIKLAFSRSCWLNCLYSTSATTKKKKKVEYQWPNSIARKFFYPLWNLKKRCFGLIIRSLWNACLEHTRPSGIELNKGIQICVYVIVSVCVCFSKNELKKNTEICIINQLISNDRDKLLFSKWFTHF